MVNHTHAAGRFVICIAASEESSVSISFGGIRDSVNNNVIRIIYNLRKLHYPADILILQFSENLSIS